MDDIPIKENPVDTSEEVQRTRPRERTVVIISPKRETWLKDEPPSDCSTNKYTQQQGHKETQQTKSEEIGLNTTEYQTKPQDKRLDTTERQTEPQEKGLDPLGQQTKPQVKIPDTTIKQTKPLKSTSQTLRSAKRAWATSLTSTSKELADINSGINKTVADSGDANMSRSSPVTPTALLSKGSRTIPSLFHKARERRARRVRFYRNGDRFFKGMVYAVSTDRFRSFENLLKSLTSSTVCDNRTMPNGVRNIFTLDGARRINGLNELEDGESYVCASSEIFRTLDYAKNEDHDWGTCSPRTTSRSGCPSRAKSERDGKEQHRSISSQSQNNQTSAGTAHTTSVSPSRSATSYPHRESARQQHGVVTPRLITVLKQGKRPRRAVRLLLNRKTAQNFEQVMRDITETIKMDCGSVRKLFGLSGRPVNCLADFFGDDTVFIASSKEKISTDQLDLDHRELRQVNAYRPFSATMRDRVTLRRTKDDRLRSRGSSESTDTSRAASSSKSDGLTLIADVMNVGDVKRPYSSLDKLTQKSQTTHNNQPKDVYKSSDSDDIPKPMTLTNKYEVGPKIGTGNFAVVFECRDKKTKRKYALKIINKESCKGREKMIDNEVRILRYVNHPNIIRLIEDFINKQRIFYIMELVKGGDLFDAISSATKYTEADASGMLHNLISALDYLHAMRIVHRDVKPENLLIQQHEDGTKSLKLGDFGLATEVKGQLYTVCGTPTYVAPEVIAESGYGVKIDVWSAGVIAYILLCGFPPFSSPSDDQEELFDLIMTACYDFPLPYWDGVSQNAKNLIKRMLELDPDRRLSAAQILQHKWVAGEATSAADLQKSVSSSLGTYFRRSPRNASRNAGIQIMATTALDKVSRYFKGRGSPLDKEQGKSEE